MKERPRCRNVIIQSGLRPGVAYDTAEGMRVRELRDGERWNGLHVVSPSHTDRPVSLTDGMRKQVKKMLAEGYWRQCGGVGR